jgi:hypothetical protein
VTYGAHPREQLETLSPKGMVETVDELAQWLSHNG